MIDWILRLHGPVAYAIIFAVPALEASVFLGFVFPGEIAVLLGGVLAFHGRVTLGGAIAAAVAGAIIGDSIGYEVGRHFGTRLLDGPLRRFVKPDHRARATAFLRRHGGKAVFLGRFTAALRVLVPGIAGIAEIPYPNFLLYNALGGITWATGFTLLGYAAGNGYRRVEHLAGRASEIVLGLMIAIALIALAARWVAHHPDRIAAWWGRQRDRPTLRRFSGQIDFLAARFRPGEAFGLGLTVGVVLVTAIGIGFGVIVQDVLAREELVNVDRPILDALTRHSAASMTTFMRALTQLGNTAVITTTAGLIAVYLLTRRAWTRLAVILAAPLGALALEHAIKLLVHRPRPPVIALVHATGSSFPSGHATMAAAFYGAGALLVAKATPSWRRKVAAWTTATVIAGIVGFSRLYLRVHYFTDVLGGLALGALWLAVVASGTSAWERRRASDGTRISSAS